MSGKWIRRRDGRLKGTGHGRLVLMLCTCLFAPICLQGLVAAPQDGPLEIPPVFLSARHQKLSHVRVGGALPPIELPGPQGVLTKLKSLQGKRATVVLFWHPGHWMDHGALLDCAVLARQWVDQPVHWIGIACGQPEEIVQTELARAHADFPQLLDSQDNAFLSVSKVGDGSALPKVYVLDAQGKVAWFDIEYSEATRRELRQTLQVLTSNP